MEESELYKTEEQTKLYLVTIWILAANTLEFIFSFSCNFQTGPDRARRFRVRHSVNGWTCDLKFEVHAAIAVSNRALGGCTRF